MSIPTLHQQHVDSFVAEFKRRAHPGSMPRENYLYLFCGTNNNWIAMRPEVVNGQFQARFWTATHKQLVPDARKYIHYLLGDAYASWVKDRYRFTCFNCETTPKVLVYNHGTQDYAVDERTNIFAKKKKGKNGKIDPFIYPCTHLMARYFHVDNPDKVLKYTVFEPMYKIYDTSQRQIQTCTESTSMGNGKSSH